MAVLILLRAQIDIVAKDTLVVAEEFGDWADSSRRIDLLGLDQDANLVVFELKRTEDGGHMERSWRLGKRPFSAARQKLLQRSWQKQASQETMIMEDCLRRGRNGGGRTACQTA